MLKLEYVLFMVKYRNIKSSSLIGENFETQNTNANGALKLVGYLNVLFVCLFLSNSIVDYGCKAITGKNTFPQSLCCMCGSNVW